MTTDVYDNVEKMKKFKSSFFKWKDYPGNDVRIDGVLSVTYPITNKFGTENVMEVKYSVQATHPITGEVIAKEMTFQNGSNSFVNEMLAYRIGRGDSFRIQRTGSGTTTKYVVSEVKDAKGDTVERDSRTPPAPASNVTPNADEE